jgi:hypothetical protein
LQFLLSLSANASRDGPNRYANEGKVALSPSALEGTYGSFIVVFKEGTTRVAISSHLEWLNSIHVKHESLKIDHRNRAPVLDSHFGGVGHTFDIGGIFLGYSAQFDSYVGEHVARAPDVSPSPKLFCVLALQTLFL